MSRLAVYSFVLVLITRWARASETVGSSATAGVTSVGSSLSPDGGIQRIGSTFDFLAEERLTAAVIDVASGYAYFGTDTVPGRIIKVALGAGSAPPRRVASITLNANEDCVTCGVIDPTRGYAYFGGSGYLVKIQLGNGDDPPVRIASLLTSGNLNSATIDVAAGYAYFGSDGVHHSILKVRMGEGAAPPSLVGSVDLTALSISYITTALIDPDAGYGYFGTAEYSTYGGHLYKVALGSGDAPPSIVSSLSMHAITSGVIDTFSGYAHIATAFPSYYIFKISLGAGAAPPTVASSVAGGSETACIDTAGGFVYFGASKFALGSGADPPSLIGTALLDPLEDPISSSVIDPAAGYIYYGTKTSPGRFVNILPLDANLNKSRSVSKIG